MLMPLILSLAVFFAVILIIFVGYYLYTTKETLKYQTKRVEQVIAIGTQSVEPVDLGNAEGDKESIRRDIRMSNIPFLNTLLFNVLKSRSKLLMNRIERSGLKIKVGEFLLISFLCGMIGALLVQLIFHIPIVGFIFSLLPFGILHVLIKKRVDNFIKQLPQALDLLSGDLRAGLDIQTGLKHLSEEFPDPIGEEFAKVVVEINLGLALSEALNNLSKRIDAMDVQMLCTGIIINRELGGNLSELIGNICDTVRERFRIKGMIKALTAENQMSSMLLIILPIGLYILLNVLAPSTYNSFAAHPIGQLVLGGCVVSMTIGYLIIKKITTLEV